MQAKIIKTLRFKKRKINYRYPQVLITYRYKASSFPWGLANLTSPLFWWFRITSCYPRSWVTNSLRLTTGTPFLSWQCPSQGDPTNLIKSRRVFLQVHSPLLLQRSDPSCLSEYWLPWVGLYPGLTSRLLQRQWPGVPGASCHPWSESGTQHSSSSATWIGSGKGQV